jgi:hypothetical protein
MLKNTKVQTVAVFTVGGLLGYIAASGRPAVLYKAHAESPPTVVAKTASNPVKSAACSCCGADQTRTEMVAMAAHVQESSGKKPNILFIMADDIGWMQPACYH